LSFVAITSAASSSETASCVDQGDDDRTPQLNLRTLDAIRPINDTWMHGARGAPSAGSEGHGGVSLLLPPLSTDS
jgi:hypothetical protein